MTNPGISIVIPAFNEAMYLPGTLGSANAARKFFERETGLRTEVVVVDNDSTDSTSQVATSRSALVVHHATRNIASVRNAGIRSASFDLVVTLDADCLLPEDGLLKIWEFMKDDRYIGGALGLNLLTDSISKRILAKVIIALAETVSGMNGAMFCFWKADALAFGGFRESLLIAEDKAFVQDLKKYGALKGKKFAILRNVRVQTCDRKDVSVKTIVPQLWIVLKAIAGRRQSLEELDYWYKPKR